MESFKSGLVEKGQFVPKYFVIDVDGVLTDGKFYYTAEGKVMKKFGPDDADALSILRHKLTIHMISGDKRGFSITKKRIDDMKYPVDLVSTFDRIKWMKERFDLNKTIFMGDGIYDALVFKEVAYSIVPANAFYKTKELADFVTKARGSECAVAEACVHVLENFFDGFDVFKLSFEYGSGAWSGPSEVQ